MKTFTIAILDMPNRNGRTYPTEVVREAIKKYEARKNKFGVIGMPAYTHINMDDVTHTAENLRIEDGKLLADIKLMKTPRGKMLESILDQCEFRIAGVGDVGDDGVVYSLDLISINAVLRERAA